MKTAQEKKLISAKKSERDSRKIPVRSEELKDRTQIKISTVTSHSLRKVTVGELARSSEKERRVDAMALIAEEGRDKLRKVEGSCK